jgi:hypothetical protein
MEQTVLYKAPPGDGFRASIARAIRQRAQETFDANPDSSGSDRHLRACEQLADHIEDQPLEDPLFRLLLAATPDSDNFSLTGEGPLFVQILGADLPAPQDVGASWKEFAVACAADLSTGEHHAAEIAQLRAEQQASQTALSDRINELEAELDARDRKIAADSQELSDMRGTLQRSGAAENEALSRRVAALEGELHQANARAAAAESKTARRARKTKTKAAA